MKSRWLVVAGAVIMGILAAVLAGGYMAALRAQTVAASKPVEVLVARSDIPKGTPVEQLLSAKMIETRKVPQQYVSANAISSLHAVDGQVVSIPLAKGEQLSKGRFQYSTDAGLSFAVPKGMVALTIPADDVRGVGGMIKPGDNIAIMASGKTDGNNENSMQTSVLIPGASVLAVGTSTGVESEPQKKQTSGGALSGNSDTSSKKIASSITLALAPTDAAKVVLAEEAGSVWLALLPTEEKSVPSVGAQTRETVWK